MLVDTAIATTAAPATPRAPRAAQAKQIADYIAATRTRLETVRADVLIASLLAARGFDHVALGTGLALVETAQDRFNARQSAMAANDAAVKALGKTRTRARAAFRNFRDLAAAAYAPGDASRVALNVNGRVPDDDDRFLTLARSAIAASANPPYADALAHFGFDAAARTAVETTLAAFEQARQAQATAADQAVNATRERDAATQAVRDWMRPFERVAAVIARSEEGSPARARLLRG
jgi:hypothetical protein